MMPGIAIAIRLRRATGIGDVTAGCILMRDNKNVYQTVEFDRWSQRKGLGKDEHFLISHYLDRSAPTVEAGTGGGRLLLAMKEMGFSSLQGFDFVPELIAEARLKDPLGSIDFQVQDAKRLTYGDAAFQQSIYLQQLICLMGDGEARLQALREAFRILMGGGTALFSFLCFEVRSQSLPWAVFLTYLRMIRAVLGVDRDRQTLPWLRLGDRFHLSSFLDAGPYVYWYRIHEIAELLQDCGFRLRAIGTSRQVERGQMPSSPQALLQEPIAGALYCVCTKPL